MFRISAFLSSSALSIALGFFGALALARADGSVTLTHVHGLSYSADGKRLMMPSHHGLAIYENGKWSKAPGPQHDFMGFSATSKRIYASGHPAPGSGLVDPFGLMRSRDGGKSWKKLGLEGETDFHLLATSWNANAIYVWNPAPSSRMKRRGLHYTLNDGLSWRPSEATGLDGNPQALAVHADNPASVAVATSAGLFVSRDSGQRFVPLAKGTAALSVYFDLDGKHLWYGSFEDGPQLARLALDGGKRASVALPALGRDAVAHIAQNPSNRAEYALATFERSVYLTRDAPRTWIAIAERGRAK